MAVDLLAHEVADLCIGKPALRSLPPCATVGEALLALKQCGDSFQFLAVWGAGSCPPRLSSSSSTAPFPDRKSASGCLGRVCMVDIICFLCSDADAVLTCPSAALRSPVTALLPDDGSAGASIGRVERHSSVVEALDVMLGGAQSLMVPLQRAAAAAGGGGRKLHLRNTVPAFCWLTQEDLVRFFLSSIAAFSPVPALSVEALGIVRSDALTVRYHEPALAALPLIREALVSQTAVAVVTDDGKLIGEISPSTLANCDETVAAAIVTLTAGELMAYIDSGGLGGPPGEAVRAVKARLAERGLRGLLQLVAGDDAAPDASLSSSSGTNSATGSSSSSSSDEEEESTARAAPRGGRRARYSRSGSYSARMGRRSEDAIVCHRWSSLVAVMIQALAHRVSYVWVVEDDYHLAGLVTFPDVLAVFREQLVLTFDNLQR